jgi:hypothetical protein
VVLELIVSQFLDGPKVTEIIFSVEIKCTKRTVFRVVAEFHKKLPKNAKEQKKQPVPEITPNMYYYNPQINSANQINTQKKHLNSVQAGL